MLFDDELKALLAKVKTIAVIGAKDKPGQDVDRVGRYLMEAGFTVIPVHPKRTDVWGLATYPSILDVPEPVDLVDVFRAPQYCPGHAGEVLELEHRPACFWMQAGIASREAAELLAPAGVTVVQDACLMVEHRRLFG
ncbi:CoA-binding protein [Desulfocurvus sp. DL9XJH121]